MVDTPIRDTFRPTDWIAKSDVVTIGAVILLVADVSGDGDVKCSRSEDCCDCTLVYISSLQSHRFIGNMSSTPSSILGNPFPLPVSKQIISSNRFLKAAMTENLADPCTGQPNERHCCLYSRFVGCGMVLTGNVMVDRQCKESSRNVVLDETSDLEPFRKWSRSFHGGKAIMRLIIRVDNLLWRPLDGPVIQ